MHRTAVALWQANIGAYVGIAIAALVLFVILPVIACICCCACCAQRKESIVNVVNAQRGGAAAPEVDLARKV